MSDEKTDSLCKHAKDEEKRDVERKKLGICLILFEFFGSIFVLFVYERLELFSFVHHMLDLNESMLTMIKRREEKKEEFREMKQNTRERERERVIFVDVNKDHEQRLKQCACAFLVFVAPVQSQE